MKKFNFSKVLVIGLLIILASLASITLTAKSYGNGQPNAIIKVINDGTGTADSILSAPGNFLRTKADDFSNALNAFSQNQVLKKKLSNLTEDNQKIASLETENKALKAALQLQNSLTDYNLVDAAVIDRAPSSWNDRIIIDKGSSSGLVNDTLVMANGGIIGKVSQVNNTTSKVDLLTNPDSLTSKIPVQIDGNPCMLTDFDTATQRFVITNLNSQTNIKKGDPIVTSGLDGKFPSDLMIGNVDEIQQGNSPYSTKIYATPSTDFNNLRFVSVVAKK